jgi:hypothetical protein
MAVGMIGPKFYAWDENGEPLSGGKLYTYLAGTTTPKATYTSEDGVVANTNPVILNAEGYADVYLIGSYNMVLYDLNDNMIWSSDPVSSTGDVEWANCEIASYISTTSIQVSGNVTSKYDKYRRVRVDNGVSNYSYSTVLSSSYAGGYTTIILSDSIVSVGVLGVCTSVIGADSTPFLSGISTQELLEDKSIQSDKITTVEYYTGSGKGGAIWAKTGNIGPPGGTDFANGLLYDANGYEREISVYDRIDVSQFGARNSDTDSAHTIFQKTFAYAKGKDIKVIAIGEYTLHDPGSPSYESATYIDVYNDFDFSSAKLNVNLVAFQVLDDRTEIDTTLTNSSFTQANMTEGITSLGNVITDAQALVDYENSYVRIDSSSVYIYRYGATAEPPTRKTVTVMGRFGRLGSSLTTHFNDASDVTIYLRKLPTKRLKCMFGEVNLTQIKANAFLFIKRDMVDVFDLVSPSVLGYEINLYRDLIRFHNVCFGTVNGTNVAGIGVTSDETGVSSRVAYDIWLEACYGINISNCYGGTSWKNVDMANTRNVNIRNSVFSKVHGHFGCADITIEDCVLMSGGSLFGTGALDSVITWKNCKLYSKEIGVFGLRNDYGELRGDIKILNCEVIIKADRGGAGYNSFIIDLKDEAIQHSGASGSGGATNPASMIYSLPNVYVDGLKIINYTSEDVDIIKFASGITYASDQRLKMPRVIDIKNVNYDGVSTKTFLNIDQLPYDYSTMELIKINIENIKSVQSGVNVPIHFNLEGASFGAPPQNALKFYAYVKNCFVTNLQGLAQNEGGWYGHRDSSIVVRDSRLIDGIDGYAGGTDRAIGIVDIDNCVIEINESIGLETILFASKYSKFTNSIIDCTGLKVANDDGLNIHFYQTTHIAYNNTAINCYANDEARMDTGILNSVKRKAVINNEGEYGVYEISTAAIEPSWYTTNNKDTGIVQVGRYYIWVDPTGDVRVSNSFPDNVNSEGTIIGTQS